ncbi:MAG: hypothetical protein H7224_08810 [Polaromonas sp.]|nr:hypothetical protein [Polaromonas sp.]
MKANDVVGDIAYRVASGASSGKGVRFLFFPDSDSGKTEQEQFLEFKAQAAAVQKESGLTESSPFNSHSVLDGAEGYWNHVTNKSLAEGVLRLQGDQDGGTGPLDLFRGTVDNLLAPYIAAIRIEGFNFSYPQWQRVFGSTPEQTRYLKSKVEALESVNKHGLIKKLRQTVSIVGDESIGSEPLLMQTTTNQNAVAQLEALDRVLAASLHVINSMEA